ncbi:MAG: acyl-CoA dehydrogenase family protein [Rhodospirillales bacterium]|nr:acyl-CoA dehydrogenase family protein [Rhodospirillales bacterium]
MPTKEKENSAIKGGRKPIPVPEPDLTPAELIRRAIDMRELIRDDQDAADERGCPSQEVQDAFVKNGFYRILQPRMFGGYEFDYTTFFRVMMEVARGNPGTGWCLALGASHAAVVAAHWPNKRKPKCLAMTVISSRRTGSACRCRAKK